MSDKRAENLEYLIQTSQQSGRGPAFYEAWHPKWSVNGRSEWRRRWNKLKQFGRDTIRGKSPKPKGNECYCGCGMIEPE